MHPRQRGQTDVLGAVEDEALVELVGVDKEIVLAGDGGDLLGGFRFWTLPVGLSGETTRMPRVRGVIARSAAVSIWNPVSTTVGTMDTDALQRAITSS